MGFPEGSSYENQSPLESCITFLLQREHFPFKLHPSNPCLIGAKCHPNILQAHFDNQRLQIANNINGIPNIKTIQ